MPLKKLLFNTLRISLGGFIAIGWIWYQNIHLKKIRIIIFPIAIALSIVPIFIPSTLNTVLVALWFFVLLILISNQTLYYLSKHEKPTLKIPWQITISGLLLITFSFLAPAFIFTDYGFTSSTPITQNIQLHYNQTIQPNEARLMATFLRNIIDSTNSEIIQYRFHKTDSSYVVTLDMPNSTRNNDIFFLEMILHAELKIRNQDFFEKPTQMVLAEAISGKTRSLSHQYLPTDSLQLELLSLIPYQHAKNQIIFHNVAITSADLLILRQTLRRLKKYFPEHQKYDILFLRCRHKYVLKFFVPEQFWSNHAQIERYIEIGQYLEKSGLFQPVRIELIDRNGKRFHVPTRL